GVVPWRAAHRRGAGLRGARPGRTNSLGGDPGRTQAGASDCFLFASISSHPGERFLVGQGLHGVDQCDPCPAAVHRPLSAASTCRSGLLRFAVERSPRTPGGNGSPVRYRRILLPPLLVRRPQAAGAALSRSPAEWPARLSLLPVLGE